MEQVHQALDHALSTMKPTTQTNQPMSLGDNVFRPHVELGTETIHSKQIQGKHKAKTYGGKQPSYLQASLKAKEACLIESTSNSVRVSFLFKQETLHKTDPLEASILFQWMRFLQQQAEDYRILRRKPVEGYSISFLITNCHVEEYTKESIEGMILAFASQMDKECSDIKIQVNAQARYVATEFWKAF